MSKPPEPLRLPAGYIVVIDADGAEVPGSKRDVSDFTVEDYHKACDALERVMGTDCQVVFKESGNGGRG